MNPLIRIRLAQLLARRYKLEAVAAVNLAEELSALLQAGNLDIVLSSWVDGVGTEKKEGFWEEVAKRIERIDEDYGDWAPWKP